MMMQCSVVLVLWLGVELVYGGALRCVPGEDSACAAEDLEIVPALRMSKSLSGTEKGESRGVYCLIGSEWDSSCGSCRCSESGRAVCQRREGCSVTDEELEQQCAPDTAWRNDCNSCWCSDQGRAMCTRIGCPYVIHKETETENKPSTDKSVPEPTKDNDSETKIKAETKEEITRHKLQNQPTVDKVDDADHLDVESGKESLETLDHSYEELDYNIEPENSLNHVHPIQEQNNLLEELVHSSNERRRLLKRSVCKPSEMFQAECNICKCAPDGQSYSCTHNECMEGEKNKEVEVFMESEGLDHVEHHMVCAARGTFYIGCNTCHCNALGTDYSCSNKPCPLPEDVELFHELKTLKSSNNRSTKQVCVANRMFIKDCNRCWCNEDGTSFVCTRRVCVPDLPEPGTEEFRIIKKECRPNEVFELDCNMCRCNPDGKSYSCTRRACVDVDPVLEPVGHPAVEPVVLDAKVLAGPQKTDVDPKIVLDQIVAGPVVQDPKVVPIVQDLKGLPVVDPVDQPGPEDKKVLPVYDQVVQPVEQPAHEAVVKDAKNQTLVRKSRATEELRKACQPGQEFRMDCNTCLCDNQGKDFSCTRHDCNTPNGGGELTRTKRETSESAAENVTMQCVAGSVFNRDCNVCRCADDGQRAVCTHKSCVAPAKPDTVDADSNVPESDPNFRCNPGEQLKRGCNDCQCSADGRSVFCTVRFCDQDITPPPPSV